jgi:hypothetical protein
MIRRLVIGAALCAGTIAGFGGTALAGEWAPGAGGKLTPVHGSKGGVANSECAFSGRDEPDSTEDHYGEPGDDGLWGATPSKGKVQSPGQLVAAGFAPPGLPGLFCRGAR